MVQTDKKMASEKTPPGNQIPLHCLTDWIGINILFEGTCTHLFGSRYHRVAVLVLVPTASPGKTHTTENERKTCFEGISFKSFCFVGIVSAAVMIAFFFIIFLTWG